MEKIKDDTTVAAADDTTTTTTTTGEGGQEGGGAVEIQDAELMNRIKAFVNEHNNIATLVLLIPTYGFMCNVDFVISLMNTLQLLKTFEIQVIIEFCKNDSLISRARNNLIAKAMAHENSESKKITHFMFIDSDIIWNPWDILKLMVADKEIIGGIYPKKKYYFERMLEDNFPKKILETKKDSFLKDMDDLSYLKCKLVDCNLNYLSNTIEIKNNHCQVRHLATGFMMIKRSLIEELQTIYPQMKYEDDCGFLNTKEQVHAYAFFNTEVSEGHFMSEDWYFCDLCRKQNKQIFVDISINLCHVGQEYYSGSILASLV